MQLYSRNILKLVQRVPRSVIQSLSLSTTSSLDESLIITNGCVKRIKALQKSMSNDDLYLRVVVDSGGCSGFQYVFNMEKSEDVDELSSSEDLVFQKSGAKVKVDPGSFEFIKGATIDFEQELIRSAFAIVNNPQSESACGCGSSFALKNFEANPALD
jgi:iron-sulfur cluster assembly accessory protein